jgi:4-carboxymuconolactone decarboxylase
MPQSSSPPANPLDALTAVTPKLMELTTKVLFGDVWERPGLSKRDRSLITVAVLTALYRPEQLGELITHVAFYSGWPTAVTAASVAKRVFDEQK